MLRCRLLLEEVLEFIAEAGYEACLMASPEGPLHPINKNSDKIFEQLVIRSRAGAKPPNLVAMVKELSDISVVTTGAFAALGVRIAPCLEIVDNNNLMKVATGKLDEFGKFQKSPDHPEPTPMLKQALRLQGWEAPE